MQIESLEKGIPLVRVGQLEPPCFSNGETQLEAIPDWLSVEFSFDANQPRFYSVWVVPWIAEPALVLGALELDGSVEG
jgi:hypothetical protein